SVRLFLPVAEAAPAEMSTGPAAAHEPPPSLPGGSETILVVEDDARVRRVAVARLEDMNYRVLQAENAAAALRMLAAHPEVALLFTDIVMPGGMSGDELAREARRLMPDLKIILTSGFAEPSVAVRELAAEASWLKKPYSAMELAVRIRELLD
ncbi:MAG: response regulator, partial [Hyphomicrobiales bacterium]